jgi:hypothetical protein
VYRNAGLGYTQQDALDCSNATGTFWGSLNAAFNPKCFAMSQTGWEQAAQFGTLSQPVAPAAPTQEQIAATYSDPSALPGVLVDQAAAATQAQTSATFANQLSVGPGCTGATLSADGTTWTCPTSTNWLMWAAIAAAGLGVVLLLKGGR